MEVARVPLLAGRWPRPIDQAALMVIFMPDWQCPWKVQMK
jgi:hypothetical protein